MARHSLAALSAVPLTGIHHRCQLLSCPGENEMTPIHEARLAAENHLLATQQWPTTAEKRQEKVLGEGC